MGFGCSFMSYSSVNDCLEHIAVSDKVLRKTGRLWEAARFLLRENGVAPVQVDVGRKGTQYQAITDGSPGPFGTP